MSALSKPPPRSGSTPSPTCASTARRISDPLITLRRSIAICNRPQNGYDVARDSSQFPLPPRCQSLPVPDAYANRRLKACPDRVCVYFDAELIAQPCQRRRHRSRKGPLPGSCGRSRSKADLAPRLSGRADRGRGSPAREPRNRAPHQPPASPTSRSVRIGTDLPGNVIRFDGFATTSRQRSGRWFKLSSTGFLVDGNLTQTQAAKRGSYR